MTEVILDPRDHAPNSYLEMAASLGITSHFARRLMSKIIGQADFNQDNWTRNGHIPKNYVRFSTKLPRLELIKDINSQVDDFHKLVFKTADELLVESVIIPLKKENNVTICLSSQVGCVMGCSFCATARMKNRRNLKTWEIVDQFLQSRELAQRMGKKVTGTVFMGMGEPFLNYYNVLAAAEILCYPILNSISAKAITISTVGLLQEIERFTNEKRPFRLSISLGAATDEKRRRLVPVAARTPVADIMSAARKYSEIRKDRVMLSYVCISGENVGQEDAIALAELIKDTPVRLDLIEVNDTSGRFLPPSQTEMDTFRDALSYYLKQPVVRRYSGGGDIRAACGTLSGQL